MSKNNSSFYSTYREYFGNPKTFDHNQSVVHPIPATALGYKKNSSLNTVLAEKKKHLDEEKYEWTRVYSPISEINSVRYKTLRNYFNR